MENQQTYERYAGDTEDDEQAPRIDDLGRARCALFEAAQNAGVPTHELPLWILHHPYDPTLHSLATFTFFDLPLAGNDLVMPHVKRLQYLIEKLGALNTTQVRVAIAQHIHSTMSIEMESVSEEDTLALIIGQKQADSSEAKLVTQMYDVMNSEYKGFRPIEKINLTVDKLCDWHRRMFQGLPEFDHKKIGELRESGVASKGGRHYPSRKLAAAGLQKLCDIVNTWAKERKPEGPLETMMEVFALAAFTQYHFVDLHPFLDGNGRMCRYISKYILESVLPIPFPMYQDRDEYLGALKSGDALCQSGSLGQGARWAYLPLLALTLKSAITFYEELLQLTSRPFLIASTFEGIAKNIKEQQIECTAEDEKTIEATFDKMDMFGSATIKLTKGSVEITKVEPMSASFRRGGTARADVDDDLGDLDIESI
eukprot:m.383781 g.383781  ORF g.383781 m.383781 type:complete len:426 (-) comp16731_c1_seq2:349-1626(-)